MNSFSRLTSKIKKSLIMAGFIKSAKLNTNGKASVTSDIKNIAVKGNNRQDVVLVMPSGYFGIPHDGTNVVLIDTGDIGANPIALGVLVPLKELPYTPKQGEAGLLSDNWMLVQQNDAIKAFKLDDKSYSATLCRGESVGKYLFDILSRLDTIDTHLNTHTHAGVTTGNGVSGIAQPILPDSNLTKDKAAIQNEEYLLNKNAKSN